MFSHSEIQLDISGGGQKHCGARIITKAISLQYIGYQCHTVRVSVSISFSHSEIQSDISGGGLNTVVLGSLP